MGIFCINHSSLNPQNFLLRTVQEKEIMATLLGSESPWTGGKRSSRNIIAKITHSQIAGQGFSRGTQLPEALLQERDKRAKWHGIPELLQKLHESSHPNSDLSHTHSVLKELSSLLSMEAMSFVTEDRKSAQESTFPNTYTFDLFGGVDLLVEILMRPTLTMQKKKPQMNDDLVKDCLSVLYNCCICTEGVTKSLAARDDFVLFLFTLMTNKKTFLQTATLIEDILGVKKDMIQLEGIPNLSGLVQSFDQQQLANFCRILSVTISEPDVRNDDKHTLLAKNAQQKRNASPSRAEVNQVTLLNIPGFIERLCKLATRKVSEATGASNFLQELEDWYTWLDNALVLDALMQMATEEAEHSSTGQHPLCSYESSMATSPLRHRLPQSMKIVHEIMYKVEVLYVLCVLLMGRQRNQVHKMLAEFRLIPGLNNLFDKLIWRKYTSSDHVVHGQNENCDCSPEISFKIQFLRLLQSFSDHHENKYLLLNSQELNELSAISLKANIPEVEALVNTDRSLVCDGKKGLLTRLLAVMKREPPDSSFRFWQARAVESFLRGATSYADQMFLLKRGLLEHILFCIIDSGCKSRDVLQSYFDLLGELMKFNIDAFKRFNKYVSTDDKFQTFMTQINSSLVDSNMLVRCIVLSLDRFESQTEDVKVVEVLSECCLLSYMARVENRLSFLFRLVNVINVQTLTQENVSCLNTSLVVLMLARRRGKLPFYLNTLREKEYAEKYPGCLLNNFHNLLRFWQRHYLNKDKDSTCLENSSCIPFDYWKETVSVLLGSDRTSLCAIASYIDEPFMELDRDLLED
uniref:Transient receptor potential cation channel, subfamily C, member 4 associated protein a n=2 Tax=Oncorhynchus TaxID=8016 RepID=A0A8C8H458_ONCTS